MRWHCPKLNHVVIPLTGTVNDNPYDPRVVDEARAVARRLLGSWPALVKLERGQRLSPGGLHLHLMVDARAPLHIGSAGTSNGAVGRVAHIQAVYDDDGLFRYLSKPAHAGAMAFRPGRPLHAQPAAFRLAVQHLRAGQAQCRIQGRAKLARTLWLHRLGRLPGWLPTAYVAREVPGLPSPLDLPTITLDPATWARVAAHLSPPSPGGRGRPRQASKQPLELALARTLSGAAWNRLPNYATAFRRHQQWDASGAWAAVLRELNVPPHRILK
ncbi:hypothetical protein QR90_08760 [Deinococcus radiopugnans]|uniref:Insertion element IS402-like domain-containing protein n=1 Tax=Deinococcus radiopugnans TaxID=57497 RepID=A0A0A7KIW7_9DEIO|nr:hypothetical protein QR90_08760 [Deinococcus radiopugnans]